MMRHNENSDIVFDAGGEAAKSVSGAHKCKSNAPLMTETFANVL